jgi:hypothetical protein
MPGFPLLWVERLCTFLFKVNFSAKASNAGSQQHAQRQFLCFLQLHILGRGIAWRFKEGRGPDLKVR